jgi:hypothetical protein
MNNKLKVEFMPNHLFKNIELVNRLALYDSNIKVFQKESLNELAMLEDQ